MNDRSHPRSGALLGLAIAAIVAAIAAVGVYRVNTAFDGVSLGVQISEEAGRFQQLTEEKRRLLGDLASLKQPRRIEEAAIRMGLRTATEKDIVRLTLPEVTR
jgi:hypothetical protein